MIKTLFDWLRRIVQAWLREEAGPVSRSLEVIHGGAVVRVVGLRTIGLRIECQIVGPKSERYLIGAGQAVDQVHFWRLWEELGGGPLRWDDGTPFSPI